MHDLEGKDTLRLFISLPLCLEVKEALLEVQNQLPREYFKPLPKDNFHLTLAFLGDTPLTDIPALKRILDEVATQTSVFSCALSGLGAFPNPWEPRVVWAGIDTGSKEAGALSDALRARLRQAKVSFDTKPFRPHITIAYARKNLSRKELREAGEAFSTLLKHLGFEKQKGGGTKQRQGESWGRLHLNIDPNARAIVSAEGADPTVEDPVPAVKGPVPAVQFRMEEVALVKSELRPEGAIHTPIHEARFQGGKG